MDKKLTKNQRIVIYSTISVRLLSAFLILKWPIFGMLICMIADSLDFGTYLAAGIRVDYRKFGLLYQRIDKSLDQYYYTFILLYFISNFSSHLLNIVLILYFLRLTGFFLFQSSKKCIFLFLFQNIFENFSLITLIFISFFRYPTNKEIVYILLLATILKIPQEISIHISKRINSLGRKVTYSYANTIRSILNLHPLAKTSP